MGWLRDIFDIATSPEGRRVIHEVADLVRMTAEVRRRMAAGPTENDLVSHDARRAVDAVLDSAAASRARLAARYGGAE
jgi:hypothetical protein